MAVGRISGPLLASNLLRDGRDIAFETDLLYIDVVNGRIGIKTTAPQNELDVVGTIKANILNATTATIGAVRVTGNVISTTAGSLTLTPSGGNNIILSTPVYAQDILVADSGIPSTGIDDGALTVNGGAGIDGDLNVGGITKNYAQIQAYGTDTGTLIVDGGVGISKDLWVGGLIHGILTTSTVAGSANNANNILINEITALPQPDHYILLAEDLSGYQPVLARYNFKYDLNNDKLVLGREQITSAETAVSSGTGALQVVGGVGIGRDLYVNGNITGNDLTINNIEAAGNIHAVGNITAEGNIQLGNNTGTDTLIVDAVIDSDLIPKVDNKYSVGVSTATWAEGYFNNLYSNIVASQTGSINISPADNLLQINANIRVVGDKPIGTAPVVTNVLYVTEDGDDTNDGRAEDASRACRTITGALRSPYYTPGTSIKVAPGKYLENNPLVLLPYTSVIGSDLRTTVIEAINKTQDLFHVQSGCYIFAMQFLNGRSGVLPGPYANGYNRGAYCIAFPPQVGGNKIDTFHSPYVQNCTNQTGPWMYDGIMFQPNQTVQVPLAVGTGTWVANTTTIVVTVSTGTITSGMSINNGQQDPGFFNARTLLLANKPFIQEQTVAYVNQTYPTFEYQQAKCFRDVGIILENIAYDSAFGGNEKSVEAGLAYYDGVVSLIAGQETQTTAAINYINTLSQLIISNSVAPDLLSSTGTYAQVINTALVGGTIASDSINKNLNIITTVINNGTSYAPAIYKSSGPDEDFVSAEILLQANRTFIQNDVMAWISNTYPNFVYNQDSCYRDVGLIVDAVSQDIMLGGNTKTLEAALSYWRGGYPQITGQESTTTQAITHAKNISLQIIANQTVTPQPAFAYDVIKCERDIGLIVDSIAFDLMYDGTSQSVFAGLQYWDQDGYTGEIDREITTTTNAIIHLRSLMDSTANGAGGGAPASTVTNLVNVILDILTFGTAGVSDNIIPNGYPSSNANVISAYNAILAAKSSYQDDVINYINANNAGFSYNESTCRRDVGYIVDSVAFDLLHSGNRQSIMSGVYYFGFGGPTAIPNEKPQVTAAYNHIKNIVGDIVKNNTIIAYQSTVTQVTSFAVATDAEVEQLENKIDVITSIINNGPGVAPAAIPIELTASTSTYVSNAFDLLLQNKDFIKAEVIEYINTLYGNDVPQVINTYFSGGEAAGDAISRNFKIINDVIVGGPNIAPVPYRGGGLFASTGVQVEETKFAPTVTSITSLGGNQYRIVLNNPTIGFGTNATLYFGNTNVFPLPDEEIPEQWAQRRIDTKGGMGGMLVDGGVVSDRSPVGSMVLNAFTQVSQGGRGIHIINNGYAQLVSIFTIFCNIAVETDSGGIASITNSNSNFGDICLLAKGYGSREFSGTVFNPAFPAFIPNGEYYPSGYFPQNGQVLIFVPDTAERPHIALLMEVEPPLNYINNQGFPGFLTAAPNTGTITTGSITIVGIDTSDIAIGQTIYIRDQYGRTSNENGIPYLTTGTLVVDVGYQTITLNKAINQGGGDPLNQNYFNLYTCGNAYYTVQSSTIYDNPITIGESVIPGQQGAEASALSFIGTLTQYVISNTTPPITYQGTETQTILVSVLGGSGASSFINDKISTITNIVLNGVGVAPTIVKTGTPPSGAGSAVTLIEANVEFITQETVAYIDTLYPLLGYDKNKCARDVRLILRQLVYDLATGGNYNSVYAGLSYWSREGTYRLVQLGENIRNPGLMPDGAIVNFYQRSYMSASGYTFEYVGAGMNYGSLPQVGRADPVQTKEVVQLSGGRVFFTSTDQNGDFRIGPGLVISQATGVLSGRTFTKSLFAEMTPFILAVEAG